MLLRVLFFCVILIFSLNVQAQNQAITKNKPLIDTSVHQKGLLNGRLSTGLESKAEEAKKFKEDSKAFIESLGVKDLGKKIVKTAKKKLQPRDEYAGIKTETKLGNYGSGVRMTVEEVNAAMKSASNESFGYTEDEIVSSDIIGITYGSLFDATQTKVMTQGDVQMVKTVSWYDNEMSYVSQLVRTVKYFASKIK